MSKQRLDRLVVERGLAQTRAVAQRQILAGEVLVDGVPVDKPGTQVGPEVALALKAKPLFVGRGGGKLAAALVRFPVAVADAVAADIGASTGGFTDCLLQHGARKVYAIDVGYGQLAWSLRTDARVVVMERVNARYLERLPEPVSLIVSDVSFISLGLVYATAVRWLGSGGQVVSLIKPQFEAGRAQVGKGGVVRDPVVHRQVLGSLVVTMAALGLGLRGLMASPLVGPAGNIEFLGWWTREHPGEPVEAWIEQAMSEAAALT
ncbi:MAG: TlyA family RNA methyltransferase [Anaerolineae bacterium]|nr:TlyA family RNA methyltransferase [Anaerolineae bacterium]